MANTTMRTNTPTASAWAEWREEWPTVVAALVAYGAAVVYVFSLGLFIAPLQAEFGWSRGAISGGLLISSVLTAVAAPFVGRAIDIFGSARIGIPGMAFYCFALAMLSTVSEAIWHWWLLWLLIAIGSTSVKPTVWVSAVSRRFSASRGLALAVVMCGSGLVAAVGPSITNALIVSQGWRTAYLLLGAGTAALTIPLLLLFFRDKRGAADPASRSPACAEGGMTIRKAMLSRRFVQLAAIALVLTAALTGIQVHFVPMASSLGVDRTAAAASAGLFGIGAIIGRLCTGFLLDRFSGSLVGAVAFALPVVGSILVLVNMGDPLLTISAAAFLFGLSLGADLDVLAYMVSRYFGLKNYGTLFGTIVGLLALSAGIGPTTAGLLFDITGDYRVFLYVAMGVFVFSALMAGTLGAYPQAFTTAESGDDQAPEKAEPGSTTAPPIVA